MSQVIGIYQSGRCNKAVSEALRMQRTTEPLSNNRKIGKSGQPADQLDGAQ